MLDNKEGNLGEAGKIGVEVEWLWLCGCGFVVGFCRRAILQKMIFHKAFLAFSTHPPIQSSSLTPHHTTPPQIPPLDSNPRPPTPHSHDPNLSHALTTWTIVCLLGTLYYLYQQQQPTQQQALITPRHLQVPRYKSHTQHDTPGGIIYIHPRLVMRKRVGAKTKKTAGVILQTTNAPKIIDFLLCETSTTALLSMVGEYHSTTTLNGIGIGDYCHLAICGNIITIVMVSAPHRDSCH